MYDTVLVPTDGSESAHRAARHGAYLARAFDADVHLISILDLDAAAGPFDAGGVDQEYVDRLEADAQDAIDSVEPDDPGTERRHTDVLRGNPWETILAYAADHDVDLIAMGTHGRTGLDRLFLGSVAERVLRRADVPVLTVRADDASVPVEGYDDVVIPTDGSDAAAAAVDHGLAVARAADARVHAVHVVDVGAAAMSTSVTPPSMVIDDLRSGGERAVETVADRARDAGLAVVEHVREGSPGRDLLAYTRENDVDLVAMGTHGRTGLDRVLLGSTTERLVRRAEVPVLSVRPSE